MRFLLIGADSQTGHALLSFLSTQRVEVETLDIQHISTLPAPELYGRYRNIPLQFIVNAHHIDGFETEGLAQKELERHHVQLPKQAAKLAEALGVPLLHLSDYQVFSGTRDKPYTEEDEPHSQTLYGGTRRQGEVVVQQNCQRCVILRAGTLFGDRGQNVLTALLEQWKNGKARELSTVLQFSPTPVSDIARVIYAILQQLEAGAEPWGIYHYCSADIATPHDFAEVLLAANIQYSAVENEIHMTALEQSISKQHSKKIGDKLIPVNTVMVCEKILNTFGVRQRPWRGELTRMVKSMSQGISNDAT